MLDYNVLSLYMIDHLKDFETDSLIINGRVNIDQELFIDINNYNLESIGASYFWSDYTRINIIKDYTLKENETFQLCGLKVQGVCYFILIKISTVVGQMSKLEVLFQFKIKSIDNILEELERFIIIPFYSNVAVTKIKERMLIAIQEELT